MSKAGSEESAEVNSDQTIQDPDFKLFDVKIDRNAHMEIDKSRGDRNSATSLYPALMQDCRNMEPIEVVAKVGLERRKIELYLNVRE